MKNNIIFLLIQIVILTLLSSCRETISEPREEHFIDDQRYVVSLKDIKTPSERVIWELGETRLIEWEITPNLNNVKVLLLKKNVEVKVLEELTENDGSYSWNIPSDLPPSHHYRIQLVSPFTTSANAVSVEFEIKRATKVDDK